MNDLAVTVKVPASTANLGPGFDSLGMALSMYAWIEMRAAEQTQFEAFGEQLRGLPLDKSNLIYLAAEQVFQAAGVKMPELAIKIYSDIPLTRGLGSSASSIVGGMAAANALIGNVLTKDDLFQLATRMEDHPDNVGASLFGGIIAAHWDGHRAEYIRLEPDSVLEVVAVVPEFELRTSQARDILPQQVDFRDAAKNISHASLLVAALATGDLSKVGAAMQDTLHQPYRSTLIPGMNRILTGASQHGSIGTALSGAGPTMLCFIETNSPRKLELEQSLFDVFARENIACQVHWLKPCNEGVQLLTPGEGSSKFIDNMNVGARQAERNRSI